MRRQPKLWGSQRGKKKRERENFPMKGSNLRHSLAGSKNKGLIEYQSRASCLSSSPFPLTEAERQTARARRQGAISASETGILHQTVSRLPVANHIFLGSWMVDTCQEGCSLRSAPQRIHTAHLRWCSCGAPRNQVAGMEEVIKIHGPPGTVCLPSTWLSELLEPRKGTKCMSNRICALAEYPRT